MFLGDQQGMRRPPHVLSSHGTGLRINQRGIVDHKPFPDQCIELPDERYHMMSRTDGQ